jgi:hypothetical protein
LPFRAPQAAQGRGLVAGTDVAADAVYPFNGHIEPVTGGILQNKVFSLDSVGGHPGQTAEPGDAVVDMDDIIAGGQLGKEPAVRYRPLLACSRLLHKAEEFGIGNQGQPVIHYPASVQ